MPNATTSQVLRRRRQFGDGELNQTRAADRSRGPSPRMRRPVSATAERTTAATNCEPTSSMPTHHHLLPGQEPHQQWQGERNTRRRRAETPRAPILPASNDRQQTAARCTGKRPKISVPFDEDDLEADDGVRDWRRSNDNRPATPPMLKPAPFSVISIAQTYQIVSNGACEQHDQYCRSQRASCCNPRQCPVMTAAMTWPVNAQPRNRASAICRNSNANQIADQRQCVRHDAARGNAGEDTQDNQSVVKDCTKTLTAIDTSRTTLHIAINRALPNRSASEPRKGCGQRKWKSESRPETGRRDDVDAASRRKSEAAADRSSAASEFAVRPMKDIDSS